MDLYRFFQSIYKEECINFVLEKATAYLQPHLVSTITAYNSLVCRERQGHNGNLCFLVFTPAILFDGKKIWGRSGGIGFVAQGHEVCAPDV